MSDDEDWDCPLCMEEMDISDKNFKPCPCGYQICRFCWNHIRQNLNARCPACRREYSEQIVEFTPVTPADIQRFKNEKRQKDREKKEMEANNRRHLANMRVVQKNLVYIIGLSARLATEELLRHHDYFGQYGKILKIVVNKKNLGSYNQVQQSAKVEPTVGVYVTFGKKDEAAKCIAAIDGTVYEGRVLRASYGTTKYCSFYLRGLVCQNPGCMYLHEPGEEADSFTKEEMTQGKHHIKGAAFVGAPGSPLVGESGVVGPAAPLGTNAPPMQAQQPSSEDVTRTPNRKSLAAPNELADEWPAPSAIQNPVKSGSWATRPSISGGPTQFPDGKGSKRTSCDVYTSIHPSSSKIAGYTPLRPSAQSTKGIINTSQLHRYLSLARHAREYYLQITTAVFHQAPGTQSNMNVFVFNPFKGPSDQEQSRFGFAQQKGNNAGESVDEITERFNRLTAIQSSGTQAARIPPVATGLGIE